MNKQNIVFTILLFACIFSKAQSKLDRLNSIYEQNDTISLISFLNEWANESRQLAKTNKISNDTLKSVDEIFKIMYCPTKWRKIGRSEFGKSIYRKTKFIIVQSKIEYKICHAYDKEFKLNDSCDQYIKYNYYPDIKIKGKTILYLTPEYDSLLKNFLGSEQFNVGEGGIMNPARAKGESEKRLRFLNSNLKIVHGHWQGWKIESHPFISEIEFDMTYKKSIVYFSILYEGGETKFRRLFWKWRKVKSKMKWIT